MDTRKFLPLETHIVSLYVSILQGFSWFSKETSFLTPDIHLPDIQRYPLNNSSTAPSTEGCYWNLWRKVARTTGSTSCKIKAVHKSGKQYLYPNLPENPGSKRFRTRVLKRPDKMPVHHSDCIDYLSLQNPNGLFHTQFTLKQLSRGLYESRELCISR